MKLNGTKFQLKVWNYLKKIPKGEVRSYLEVAKAIGKPKATITNNDCIRRSSPTPNRFSGGKVLKKTGASCIKAIPPTK